MHLDESDDLAGDYGSPIIADHYQAYRPPLHKLILQKCLGKLRYGKGLDMGCGTGHSALALLPYCSAVLALDPSPAMLNRALPHPQITYAHLPKGKLPVDTRSIDLCTFAGSWFYARSKEMVRELIRVSKPGGNLLLYDFKVSFENLSTVLPAVAENHIYNYHEDLSGIDTGIFKLKNRYTEQVQFQSTAGEMAHLILSEKTYYDIYAEDYKADEIHASLKKAIKTHAGSKALSMSANLFATHYVHAP
ncbi:MAG: class I SAM-dependent methyltransferase [Saprospiraceae bacterium]|nr:class I SAM-dependent methyltransferase [Saprospiraceae bacterium]